PATRKTWKLRLLRGLYSRNLDAEDVRQWSRYIDWFLVLSPEDEREVLREIHQFEQEKAMPYVTSWERIGFDRGVESCREQERVAGLHRTIEALLDVRFRAEGLALMPEVRQKADIPLLERVVG